jgi:hypothetical protein
VLSDLALSMDVIYHLMENAAFENHMHTLFGAARRFVIIARAISKTPNAATGHTCVIGGSRVGCGAISPTGFSSSTFRIASRTQGDDRTGSFAEFFVYEKA